MMLWLILVARTARRRCRRAEWPSGHAAAGLLSTSRIVPPTTRAASSPASKSSCG